MTSARQISVPNRMSTSSVCDNGGILHERSERRSTAVPTVQSGRDSWDGLHCDEARPAESLSSLTWKTVDFHSVRLYRPGSNAVWRNLDLAPMETVVTKRRSKFKKDLEPAGKRSNCKVRRNQRESCRERALAHSVFDGWQREGDCNSQTNYRKDLCVLHLRHGL